MAAGCLPYGRGTPVGRPPPPEMTIRPLQGFFRKFMATPCHMPMFINKQFSILSNFCILFDSFLSSKEREKGGKEKTESESSSSKSGKDGEPREKAAKVRPRSGHRPTKLSGSVGGHPYASHGWLPVGRDGGHGRTVRGGHGLHKVSPGPPCPTFLCPASGPP
jgi:hypothetical protein